RLEDATARNRAGAAQARRRTRYELPRVHRGIARYRPAFIAAHRNSRVRGIQSGKCYRLLWTPAFAGVTITRSARALEVLGDKIPVDQVVKKRLDEIRPAVLEIKVIGVFPDIAGQERGLPLGHWVGRIGGAGNRQFAAAGDDPGPAAAK